jgi:hypothetical protein
MRLYVGALTGAAWNRLDEGRDRQGEPQCKQMCKVANVGWPATLQHGSTSHLNQ